MSVQSKKPLAASTMSSSVTGLRQSTNPARSSSPVPRGSSPSTVSTTNGIARTPSVKSPSFVARPNRASVRRPGQLSSNLSDTKVMGVEDSRSEQDARIESAALIDNLKKSLRNAELVSEDYQRELQVLQKEMDQVLREHAKMEERLHETSQKVESLEMQKKDVSRQVRDMGSLFESERKSMLRDREDGHARESELKTTIQRLKETLAGREMRVNSVVDVERRMSRSGRTHSRSSSVDEHGNFAPPTALHRRDSSLRRSDSPSTSRIVTQKDMVIESLKLELAEVQIKLVEMENMGGDRMQDLERTLLETRMTNARLMEDNESFQLLLGEKTLSGDFPKHDFMQKPAAASSNSGLGSLAEELEAADGESDNYRRLEAESKSLRDQNKALTLYIEKIISRVLMHDNFEIILDQKPEPTLPVSKSMTGGNVQKDLPAPPKEDAAQNSVLQRAMSVVGAGPKRSRPQSQVITSAMAPTPIAEDLTPKARTRPQSQIFSTNPIFGPRASEDPLTAPSIPLGRTGSISGGPGRGHRRTQSEKSDLGTYNPSAPTGTAANVVNQMHRGPSPAHEGGAISPVSPGSTTARTSYFAPPALVSAANTSSYRSSPANSRAVSSTTRATSVSQHGRSERVGSSANSARSRDSGEVPSPPRNRHGETTYTGAVMAQNKLRPLRLVQENQGVQAGDSGARRVSTVQDEDAARKRANRGSWMGWFNRGKDGEAPRSVSAGNGSLAE